MDDLPCRSRERTNLVERLKGLSLRMCREVERSQYRSKSSEYDLGLYTVE